MLQNQSLELIFRNGNLKKILDFVTRPIQKNDRKPEMEIKICSSVPKPDIDLRELAY